MRQNTLYGFFIVTFRLGIGVLIRRHCVAREAFAHPDNNDVKSVKKTSIFTNIHVQKTNINSRKGKEPGHQLIVSCRCLREPRGVALCLQLDDGA